MTQLGIRADTCLDVFRFSDEPACEALGLYRTEVESSS
jgi:gentisate 1,2-dioxygenase